MGDEAESSAELGSLADMDESDLELELQLEEILEGQNSERSGDGPVLDASLLDALLPGEAEGEEDTTIALAVEAAAASSSEEGEAEVPEAEATAVPPAPIPEVAAPAPKPQARAARNFATLRGKSDHNVVESLPTTAKASSFRRHAATLPQSLRTGLDVFFPEAQRRGRRPAKVGLWDCLLVG